MYTRIEASAHYNPMLLEVEKTLGSIPQLTQEQRYLLTTEGFLAYYRIFRRKYSKVESYYRISEYFFQIFGFHKYSDYDSFRICLRRYKWNNVPPKK